MEKKGRGRGKGGGGKKKKKQAVFSAVPEEKMLDFLDTTKDKEYFIQVCVEPFCEARVVIYVVVFRT